MKKMKKYTVQISGEIKGSDKKIYKFCINKRFLTQSKGRVIFIFIWQKVKAQSKGRVMFIFYMEEG